MSETAERHPPDTQKVVRLAAKIRKASDQVAQLRSDLDAALVTRNRLLAQGVAAGVPKVQLADWSGMRRESVYVAVLRAEFEAKDES